MSFWSFLKRIVLHFFNVIIVFAPLVWLSGWAYLRHGPAPGSMRLDEMVLYIAVAVFFLMMLLNSEKADKIFTSIALLVFALEILTIMINIAMH
jgi:uncharacterized membrane protein